MTDRELIQQLRSADHMHAATKLLCDAAADRLEALASRPDGWRGIESAPRDGRSVLVFCPRASDHGYERIRLTWRKDGKWQGANNTSWPPTHWMPLPGPPESKEQLS